MFGGVRHFFFCFLHIVILFQTRLAHLWVKPFLRFILLNENYPHVEVIDNSCNNYVKNAPSGDGGIWGVGVIGVVMSGNIVECAKDVGLDLEWCEDSVITGNVVRDTENGGISLFFSCKNITISGNTIYNNRVYEKEPGAYWVRAGIWLTYRNTETFQNDTGHENITITGNTIVNSPGKRRAVWVGYGKNVLIRGNHLLNGNVYHGGSHGNLGVPVKEYDGSRDYLINADGVLRN